MQVQVNLPVSYLKEGKTYVAYTPALDLSSCGKTLVEAERMFNEAVILFLSELQKSHTEIISGKGKTLKSLKDLR